MWFDSWDALLRILLVGTAAYGGLVVLLRISGKRTLAQLNAFDFVITVAFGSTLATILLNTSVTWSEGLTALALLAALQFVVAWIAARRPAIRTAITSEPVVLVHHGQIQREALRRSRLTESEMFQAIRSSGSGDISSIGAVVLETNGKLSVIPAAQYGDGSALQGTGGR